jgi:ATP-dependent DNA helicase RecQ
MRNQLDAARRVGLRAFEMNSAAALTIAELSDLLEDDAVDLLLVSPERFANPRFRETVLPAVAARTGLLVIDEAHCISDWGHDFRPDYRRLVRVLDLMPAGIPVLCTTATANDRVIADVVDQLGHDLFVLRGTLDRESLALDVLHLPSSAARLAWLAAAIPTLPGTGIVYTLTIDDARRTAEWLRLRGIDARAYTGDEPTERRLEVEQLLLDNQLQCVVATSALGMGYDKPDLAFGIHFQTPGSAIAYYQQVGRAGRALDRAVAIALVGEEDRRIQDYFIRVAFPSREDAEAVVALLEFEDEPVSLRTIERQVNIRHSRLEAMLKILEVDGVVERGRNGWRRTALDWEYPAARIESVTAARRHEQEQMTAYLSHDGCLMEFLRRELDDSAAAPCGRCSRCLGQSLVAVDVSPELVAEARSFLQGQSLTVDPRKQWPDGKKIGPELQASRGRALSHAGDGGWGALVLEQRAAGAFSDELAWALAALADKAAFDPPAEWVTCVPSSRAPELVASLAARVAARLGLPFVPLVGKTRDTPPQRDQSNSAQQHANVRGAFAATAAVPPGPVLLIDDLVDSRWTLTVVAARLRHEGSGPVHPLVLAQAQSD